MRVLIKIFLFSSMLGTTACAQDLSEKIEGKWKYADSMECPDFLIFKADGSYTILNDCGSQDPRMPVVEKGSWSFDIKENAIKLTNREFISKNSVFSEYHGKDKELVFYVKNISENNMLLCFESNNNKGCINENYTRVPQSSRK